MHGLHGGRQVDKSTLAQALASGPHRAEYMTLDDAAVLAAAHVDPIGFIGRFPLTGSANVLFLPRLADTLAGRMEIHTLWPLSQGEIDGVREGFVDALLRLMRNVST